MGLLSQQQPKCQRVSPSLIHPKSPRRPPVAKTGIEVDLETIGFDKDRLQANLGLRRADRLHTQVRLV
ncbi:hypothetical protein MMC22_010691 [Lobaria immixta]|nr:hypothetical protein [Lobaria immixta]